MKRVHVIYVVQPATLQIGDEKPGENQILMRKVIPIQTTEGIITVIFCSFYS